MCNTVVSIAKPNNRMNYLKLTDLLMYVADNISGTWNKEGPYARAYGQHALRYKRSFAA